MTALQVEIRVAGTIPAVVLEELPDLRATTQSMDTVLQGPVEDQAELIGIINRLQGWGIELHAVRRLAPRPVTADRHDGVGDERREVS